MTIPIKNKILESYKRYVKEKNIRVAEEYRNNLMNAFNESK